MKLALACVGLASSIVFLSTSAWAAPGFPGTLQNWIASGDIVQQRKDVDEVTRPQPPSGPATPVPYCSPGSPICP